MVTLFPKNEIEVICACAAFILGISRRAVVSREAKKKQYAYTRLQAYATTTVSYLHGWKL